MSHLSMLFDVQILTHAVVSKTIHGGSNIGGVRLAGLLARGANTKSSGITPAFPILDQLLTMISQRDTGHHLPPMAMQTLVPSSNKARTWSRGMKGSYQLPETKMSEVAKAVITCVTPAVTSFGGSTSLCHLLPVSIGAKTEVRQ